MSHRYPRWVDGTWVRRSDPLYPIFMASKGRPCFPVMNYLEDGTHAGFVKSFVDIWSYDRRLVQTTSANQVAVPAKHADFLDEKCVTFTANETYVANDAASNYAYLSDGTGASLLFVFTPTTVAGVHSLACTTSSAGARGLSFYHSAATSRSSVEKTGSSVYPDSSVGGLTINTPTYHVISHGAGRTPQYDLRLKSATVSSGSYASAAEAGAPSHTLRLASNSGFTLAAAMRFTLLATASPGYTAQEFETVQKALLTLYGITP